MAYVYTRNTAPPSRRAVIRKAPPPRAVVPPPRLVSARAPIRMRYGTTGTNLGEYLGILPVAIAADAIPSLRQLEQKALNSLIGVVDPGKKRDANRKARADIWCSFANAGSITAARRVLGGSKVQYTPKERQYYIDCWAKLMQSKPQLAQQAITLGALGIPEPGSDLAAPSISDEDRSALQREVDAYNTAVQTNAPLPGPATKAVSTTSGASLGPVIGIAIAGALLRKVL